MELHETFAWAASLFENASKAIISAGVLVSVVLARIAFKARKEPPPPGTPDALILALGDLTKVTQGQAGNFEYNMKLFEELNKIVSEMSRSASESSANLQEIRRQAESMREHLSAIRDAVNRK